MATLKILVVDDEPGIRSGVSRILRDFKADFPFIDEPISYDIHEAESGEEAIEIILKQNPEIILLDNKLPGMQGVEVLEWIKKNNIDTLVVMITSYASLELAVKATRDGAHDFVPKPFTPQELRSSIENSSKHVFLRKMTQQMHKEGKQIRFQFLTVLSHELKAPLNAIEGYLQIMQEKQLGEEISAYDKVIDRSLERITGMRNLILDMLDLTRLESGKTVQKKEMVVLNVIARNAIDIMRPYAIQKDVDVYLNASKRISYLADSDEMEIIFNNLISNAVKYNIQGGRVDCMIREEDSSIEITVSDTGIGMNEEEIENIFHDFYRIKNQETRKVSGSGLGLSILKKTVELYEGSVDVSSVPGKGTTFTVKLKK
ncbi:MAG TPA: ATP-binding protein [Bacteroidales bacterium]|nr:ATP-binding protein [Bacteroidales bacterium]